ncbi:MAG: hypothetical protein ABSB22_22085 [Thermodesulfobacteriota bacterium]|jgi:hypothetical protein
MNRIELRRIDTEIKVTKKALQELEEIPNGVTATDRNIERILAPIKRPEVNTTDIPGF